MSPSESSLGWTQLQNMEQAQMWCFNFQGHLFKSAEELLSPRVLISAVQSSLGW